MSLQIDSPINVSFIGYYSASLSNRQPPLSLKSDSASLPFPQIIYVRDLGLKKFLCFDLRLGFDLFLCFVLILGEVVVPLMFFLFLFFKYFSNFF